MTLLAAVLVGLCVAVMCRPSPGRRLPGRLAGARGAAGSLRRPSGMPAAGVRMVAAAVLGGGVVVWLGLSGLLLAATASTVLGGAAWLHSAARRRVSAERGRRQTLEICDALAAEMRAGQPAATALRRTAEQHPDLWPATRACVLGGDVPDALRAMATSAGFGGMTTVGAAWQVAHGSGSGLVGALERVAEGLRADDAGRSEVVASLSPARATARLLAVLPVFGLLLGVGVGGDPFGMLLGSLPGNALLLTGAGLALTGTLWVERLAQQAES